MWYFKFFLRKTRDCFILWIYQLKSIYIDHYEDIIIGNKKVYDYQIKAIITVETKRFTINKKVYIECSSDWSISI